MWLNYKMSQIHIKLTYNCVVGCCLTFFIVRFLLPVGLILTCCDAVTTGCSEVIKQILNNKENALFLLNYVQTALIS